jgi:hypothetical protein
MEMKVKGGTACEIARINKDRFNEIVHRGDYVCAPETKAGASRLFGVDDLAALFVFGRLLEQDFTQNRAGSLACRLLGGLKSYPDETCFAIGFAANGHSFAAPLSSINMEASTIMTSGSQAPLVWTMVFNMKNIKEIAKQGIEDAMKIVGED